MTKIVIRRAAGVVLVASVFVGAFIGTALTGGPNGWLMAALTWGIALAAVGVVMLGLWLIYDD